MSFRFAFALLICAVAPLRAELVSSAGNGPWSAGKTWKHGTVPKAGDSVLVRVGNTVEYDVSSDAVIRIVTVAGTLRFSREKDTLLCAGLIKVQSAEDISEDGFDCHGPMSKPTGTGARPLLEIGSADAPIPAAHTATIRLTYIDGMNRESCPALVCCDEFLAPDFPRKPNLGIVHGDGERERYFVLRIQGKPQDSKGLIIELIRSQGTLDGHRYLARVKWNSRADCCQKNREMLHHPQPRSENA